MTINQLFTSHPLSQMSANNIDMKPSALRLKMIRPVYESFEVNDAITQYLDECSAITSSDQVAELFSFLKKETKEYFLTLHLNSKNQILCIDPVSVGSLSASIVHPREVFKSVLLSSAASILMVHNHPSGSTTPSQEDIDITRRLQRAGELLGVRVLDHLIIGTEHFSLSEHGLMDQSAACNE